MDFLIVYERKNRELENAILLKLELERRGYSCDIAQYYDASKFDVFNRSPPKVILTPHLYETANVVRTLSRFGRANHIVNLQYEQVLSEKWERLGHHNPKGEAKKAFHICWGSKTAGRLRKSGVPESNVKVLGALQLDLLRKEFRKTTSVAKGDLSEKYSLPQKVKWKLFLSSFTYADIDASRLEMNESVAKTKLSNFVDIHTTSRDEILKWFDRVLQKDCESFFIYRPHPDELNLDKVVELSDKYPNFRIINEGSAKIWIEGSDHILSWYSTTVVESHALGKSYSILRPFVLPDDFDSVLLRHGRFLNNYQDFEDEYLSESLDTNFALPQNVIDYYYSNNNSSSPSYIKYSDFLEHLVRQNIKTKFKISVYLLIIANLKTTIVSFIYFLRKNNLYNLSFLNKGPFGRFVSKWVTEMNNQFSHFSEQKDLCARISAVIFKR